MATVRTQAEESLTEAERLLLNIIHLMYIEMIQGHKLIHLIHAYKN